MTASTILAILPRYPDAEQNAAFIIVGFGFVVIMLAILASVTSAIGSIFSRIKPKAPVAAPVLAAAPAPAPKPIPAAEPENPHLMHIIAAAVHTALKGKPHRISSVRKQSDSWAQEGRRQIFSSHKVR